MLNFKDIFNKSVIAQSTFKNIFSQCFLHYIVEPSWLIERIGKYICHYLNSSNSINAQISFSPYGSRKKIVHYGSINIFVCRGGFRKTHFTNRNILTWYHIKPEHEAIKLVPEILQYIDVIHTSSTKTKEGLMNIGVPEDKLTVIPLGVDTTVLRPASPKEKEIMRKKIGIPRDAICIGSFQKDGVGWSNGLEPKLIKGPDILCDVIEILASKYPIYVLLTGPARGYVKKRLRESNIPFFHSYFKNYSEIIQYYQSLDLYLITSRIEGGPESILESMACGIPVVTTDVGMAADVIDRNEIGKIAYSNTIDELVSLCESTIEEGERLLCYAVNRAHEYDWSVIAKQHYDEIYKKYIE